MGCDVHADVLGAQLAFSGFCDLTTQERAHAGEQLGQTEGLGHVVVRARVEADNHVNFVCACGENEDRDPVSGGADLTGDVEAVHVRQAEVQDDQVDAACVGQGCTARGVRAHVVSFPAQGPREGLGDGRIVFNEENCSHTLILAILNQNFHLS